MDEAAIFVRAYSSVKGFPMKINSRTRTFARQVQVDLLALPDSDLAQTIQQWVDGEPSVDIPDGGRALLGYTPSKTEQATIAVSVPPENEPTDASIQWQAPSPHDLRVLLTDMDVKVFIQYIIPLAFQSLHPTYPEWGEGLTFNAHLANHLRIVSTKAAKSTKK